VSEAPNFRIQFYGVQGSASFFPPFNERNAFYEFIKLDLLKQIFNDLSAHTDADGRLSVRIEDILGGPLNQESLASYRSRFSVPEPRVYGGWTTCCRIETNDGYDFVIDCGSGFRICAQDLVQKWAKTGGHELYLFGTHSHYDHTEGFDQAAVCFDPRNKIHVYGNRQFLRALDQNIGIFSHHVDVSLKGVQTPLSYELMPAQFDSTEIRDFKGSTQEFKADALVGAYHDVSEPIRIGKTTIQAFEVFHPSPCLAYRFENNGKVFVFCTDHELRHGRDPNHPFQAASLEAEARLCKHAFGADILYRDGQYFRDEYDGLKGIGTPHGISRVDWGHSCIEDVIEMADRCEVKYTYIGHHDPNRGWPALNEMDEELRRKSQELGYGFELARAETIMDL
jgi:phosphoribosyl 1,2-cyclic phosphodiesterase